MALILETSLTFSEVKPPIYSCTDETNSYSIKVFVCKDTMSSIGIMIAYKLFVI